MIWAKQCRPAEKKILFRVRLKKISRRLQWAQFLLIWPILIVTSVESGHFLYCTSVSYFLAALNPGISYSAVSYFMYHIATLPTVLQPKAKSRFARRCFLIDAIWSVSVSQPVSTRPFNLIKQLTALCDNPFAHWGGGLQTTRHSKTSVSHEYWLNVVEKNYRPQSNLSNPRSTLIMSLGSAINGKREDAIS